MKYLKYDRKDRVRNEDVRKGVGVEELNERINRNKLRWFSYVTRMG